MILKKNILKTAIIGFGHIGKIHFENISQNESLKLVALVDTNDIVVEDNSVSIFSTISECHTNFPDIDLYIIASPNGLHYDQAKEILDLSKNVLVEKPITLYKDQTEKLINLAKKNNVRLFTSLQLRFSDLINHVKNLIEKNFLGEIFLIRVECFWNRNNAYYENSLWRGTKSLDGGVLFTQFSHFIDVLHYLLGKLELITNLATNFTHKKVIEFNDSGIIEFKSDKTLGNMFYTISTFEKNFDSSITLIAEKGTIKIGGQYMDQLVFHNVADFPAENIALNKESLHTLMYTEIVQSLKNSKPSRIDAENAINTIDFIEKAIKLEKNV
ncbi:Gfo/Idh/MocA family oxidoreductase [Apibacter sp.]|uniref:Gfo/Idh/MocA family protein n=1 Tax=Apibacter sp. TaxID=2023709 RepID=UPI0025D61AC0|nr:Gfo/Idh/MocA family oxidoreductase [Apibacter sp.]MCT6868579.1 Gfo/Idh/MocA family oxidoreductase [Apibacter sp.]